MRAQMRQETMRKLQRELWLRRMRWVGVAVIAAAFIVAGMYWVNLDSEVDNAKLPGTVDLVERFVPPKGGKPGWRVGVQLKDGRHVFVLANEDKVIHSGEPIVVTEHHHHTGRTTFSLR